MKPTKKVMEVSAAPLSSSIGIRPVGGGEEGEERGKEDGGGNRGVQAPLPRLLFLVPPPKG